MSQASPNERVLFQVDNKGVATVTLNTPEKHNAFDDTTIALLTSIFMDIAKRKDIAVMILASTGKNFSAGADLAWMKRMANYSFEENLADANALAYMLRTLNELPQMTIARVQGAAFGGAVGLASCCDVVVANTKASFCLSEVKLGLIPATISPYVINAIGQRASRRYFTTAERFNVEEAHQLGLVSEIAEDESLDDKVAHFVQLWLNNGPVAIAQAKRLALDIANEKINNELIDITSERIATIRVSEEGQEGLTAFFEKRPANWLQRNGNEG